MKVILLGSPGVGKGTYAQELIKIYQIPSISAGELLRYNVKNNTELGLKAKPFMEKGNLVPDDLVNEMMKHRLLKEEKGYFLDGYPRTIEQANFIDSFTKIDKVLFFTASDKVIIDRLSGRRQCKKCGAIFHIKNRPPKEQGVCDECHNELYQREDDKPEAIKERLKVYREETAPLINYYKNQGILHEIDATPDFKTGGDKIIAACKRALEA